MELHGILRHISIPVDDNIQLYMIYRAEINQVLFAIELYPSIKLSGSATCSDITKLDYKFNHSNV